MLYNSFIFIILFLLHNVNGQFYSMNQRQWSSFVGSQANGRAVVRGNLLSDDIYPLPFGSQIIVSLQDVALQDVAARPLNTIVLSGSYRFPIPFEIPYSIAQIQAESNLMRDYAIQARIEKDGQLLYTNDQRISVQLLPAPVNPINIVLKRVATSIYPGQNGIFTTRAPIINGIHICLQNPDVGPCRASIQQYFFNVQSRSCQLFYWGGCAGNQNRFNTRDECELTCGSYRRRFVTNNVKQRWMN